MERRSTGRDSSELQIGRLVVEDEREEEHRKEKAKPVQRPGGWCIDLGLLIGQGLSYPFHFSWELGCVAILAGAFAFHESQKHDLEVEENVPVLDVVKIKADPL